MQKTYGQLERERTALHDAWLSMRNKNRTLDKLLQQTLIENMRLNSENAALKLQSDNDAAKITDLHDELIKREETIRNQDQMIVRLHAENVAYCKTIDRYQMNPFRRFASWLRSLVG